MQWGGWGSVCIICVLYMYIVYIYMHICLCILMHYLAVRIPTFKRYAALFAMLLLLLLCADTRLI